MRRRQLRQDTDGSGAVTKALPRGLRITGEGYVQVRIVHRGTFYHKNFGQDSTLARELAQIHLSEKRKEILMGRFGVVGETPRRRFAEAAQLYFERWAAEKDAEGKPAHRTPKETKRVIDVNLISYFGKRWFDDIRPADVAAWRQFRLKAVLGTSVNREQAVLSSIFSHIERWVKNEEIDGFKLPRDAESGVAMNPCTSVEKAPSRKRERVLTITELKNLKEACFAQKDEDLWEICGMALKSLLRKKDLANLEVGLGIDTIQAKTLRSIRLPVSVQRPLVFTNFRKRWESVRRSARIVDVEFRDLRKTAANILKMKNHSTKLISEFLGHAATDTTEMYLVKNTEHLKPLAKDLEDLLGAL